MGAAIVHWQTVGIKTQLDLIFTLGVGPIISDVDRREVVNEDLEAEKEALEKHATTMHLQNEEITAELDRFI